MDPRYYVTMYKTEPGGERRSASVHRNQMDDFFADGWILGDDFKKEIVVPKMTEAEEKHAEKIGADVPSDSTIRDEIAKDGEAYIANQAKAAVDAANDAAKEKRGMRKNRKDRE